MVIDLAFLIPELNFSISSLRFLSDQKNSAVVMPLFFPKWQNIKQWASFNAIFHVPILSGLHASESRGRTDYLGRLILQGGKTNNYCCENLCVWGGGGGRGAGCICGVLRCVRVFCVCEIIVKDAFPATLARFISWGIRTKTSRAVASSLCYHSNCKPLGFGFID